MLGILGLVSLLPAEDQAELDRILAGEEASESGDSLGEIVALKERLEALEAGQAERRKLENELIDRIQRASAEIERRLKTASAEKKPALLEAKGQLDHILEGLNPN